MGMVLRYFTDGVVVWAIAQLEPTVTITTTTMEAPLCASEHSSVKVMLFTAGWVSVLAVLFRFVAIRVRILRDQRNELKDKRYLKKDPATQPSTTPEEKFQ